MERNSLLLLLRDHQEIAYREMQIRLIPNISPDRIIGVRTPVLRRIAADFRETEVFLKALPHDYFEEDQIHSFLIASGKDFSEVISQVDSFLPYVNNWATCDQMNPKVFRKHHAELLPYIKTWMISENPYTVRFAIKMLMDHFLDADFSVVYPKLVASVQLDEYYVKMMIAWYFATGLAKQYTAVYPFLENRVLDRWIHNKAIQKAVESFRISSEQKEQLKILRVRE